MAGQEKIKGVSHHVRQRKGYLKMQGKQIEVKRIKEHSLYYLPLHGQMEENTSDVLRRRVALSLQKAS